MSGIFKNPGNDKFAHLGIGGLVCAVISIIPILQEPALSWKLLWFWTLGAAAVFVASVFKEAVVDEKFEWADIVWAMLGCVAWLIALVVGFACHFAMVG